MKNKVYFFNPLKNDATTESYMNFELLYPRFGLETWIDQTFYKLNKFNPKLNIYIVDYIPDSGIIIFHSGYFIKDLKPNFNQLFVCISADYGRNRFAQVHLFQNYSQISFSWKNKRLLLDNFFSFCENRFISHWPQPAIIQRNNRVSDLKLIGYFGRFENFDKYLASKLKNFCEKNDLEFRIVEDWSKWNDYREFDLIIAIRSLDTKEYPNKPFSKLLNAILAGVPVITSNESSSIYFRKNYFPELKIVSNEEELFNAIKEIGNDYNAYLNQLEPISTYLRNTYEFNVLSSWLGFLDEAQVLLEKWRESSPILKNVFLKSRTL